MQLGGFGGQLACSRAGWAAPEIIVSGVKGEGSSLADVFVVLYLLSQNVPIDLSKGT